LAENEAERVLGKAIEREYALADLLRRPNISYDSLMSLKGIDGTNIAGPGILADEVKEQIEIQLKYAGYIDRQAKEVERHEHYENLLLPDTFDYMEVQALSVEVRQKLSKHRPETLGQASRISGVTPAAISLLLVHLKKAGFKGFAVPQSDSQAAA
jgi:tRNA uridine 5-carboxymethylaminomethyl modification enzyme